MPKPHACKEVVAKDFEDMFRVLYHNNRLSTEHRYTNFNITEAAARRLDSVGDVAISHVREKGLDPPLNCCAITSIRYDFNLEVENAKKNLH